MELSKQIEFINLVKKGFQLNLDFTTDETEIRASIHNVRSKVYIGQDFTIEKLPINKHFSFESKSLLKYFDEQMFDLIKFIEKGNRVVPPVSTCATNYVDWQEQREKTYMFNDGYHRTALAHVLGFSEIPFIVRPIEKHIFSISMNDFVIDGKQLIVTGPKGQSMKFLLDDNTFNFDIENETIELDGILSLINPNNFKSI